MADYSSITLSGNSNTDASPTWGSTISLSGSAGANELRMALTGGAQTSSTSSANWPYMAKPTSGTAAITQLWVFTSDTSGYQIATYTGDNTKANVLRWVFSADGNPVTTMTLSCYANSTHTAPSAGTQPPGTNNDAFTNGQSSDTSSTSYIKGACYGSGLTNAGSQETPSAGSIGTNPTATTGSAGSVASTAGAWSSWQSLQGAIQYLTGAAIPHASQAFNWYTSIIILYGANITSGSWTIVYTIGYSYS